MAQDIKDQGPILEAHENHMLVVDKLEGPIVEANGMENFPQKHFYLTQNFKSPCSNKIGAHAGQQRFSTPPYIEGGHEQISRGQMELLRQGSDLQVPIPGLKKAFAAENYACTQRHSPCVDNRRKGPLEEQPGRARFRSVMKICIFGDL